MTVDKEAELVKNKFLRVTDLDWHSVYATDEMDGAQHILCRQLFVFELRRSLSGLEIHRRQLPFKHAWAITVNKAQGRTIKRVILDLRQPYWQHGSGYVAPSRVPESKDCLVYVSHHATLWTSEGDIVPVLRNVVYPELVHRA